MRNNTIQGLLISSFNATNLLNYLNKDKQSPNILVKEAPFGQVLNLLGDHNSPLWKSDYDFALIWTQPEHIISSFADVQMNKTVSIDSILSEVDNYSSLLLNLAKKTKYIIVPTWCYSPLNRISGLLDMKNGVGVSNATMRMNIRLSDNLEKATNIHLLDAQKWIGLANAGGFNMKLWYMAKIPFSNEVFLEAVKDVKSALNGLTGNARKLIIIDLDDTIWGGIVGDDGWENINLGGHDHIGEAFVDFQTALKSLKNKGILLSIVSKNTESVALEAITKHPEMILKKDDFAGWKINWNDKAQNIVDLIEELNLGLQSAVFIDDNPVERQRVRDVLPEVCVPEWPKDKMLYKQTLLSLQCFNIPFISNEDLERTNLYISERKRNAFKKEVGSVEDWLKNLDTTVKIETLTEANLKRTTQLYNKTNQMNLTTRRMSENELTAWAEENNHYFWVFRVSDKYGDSGLTGIISMDVESSIGWISDFILSCRVMGRKVEETMLHFVVNYARNIGLEEIRAKYISTEKNKPCLEFWQKSSFTYNIKEDFYEWAISNDYDLPESITLISSDLEQSVH